MNVVVLLAGGSGTRMHSEIPKQHLVVNGRQVIEYTLERFSTCSAVDAILVVSNPSYKENVEALQSQFPKLRWVVSGGTTRSESVYNGIRFLREFCKPEDKILISDAVRPLVSLSEIEELLTCLDTYVAVTTGIQNHETLLKLEHGGVVEIIPRENIVRQTSPEGYKFYALDELYAEHNQEQVKQYRNIGIDQLHARGEKVAVVMSNLLNIKITNREDLCIFEAIAQQDAGKNKECSQ